jgi:hypothetical protein
MNRLVIALTAAAVFSPGTGFGQDGPSRRNSLGVTPVGLFIDGIAYVEYTRTMGIGMSAVLRFDYVQWENDEQKDVGQTLYHEVSEGPGIGLGLRAYFSTGGSIDAVVSFGFDVISAEWESTETPRSDPGESITETGQGLGFAVHGGMGFRIPLGRTRSARFFLEPQLLVGSLLLDERLADGDELVGMEFIIHPVAVLGFGF